MYYTDIETIILQYTKLNTAVIKFIIDLVYVYEQNKYFSKKEALLWFIPVLKIFIFWGEMFLTHLFWRGQISSFKIWKKDLKNLKLNKDPVFETIVKK